MLPLHAKSKQKKRTKRKLKTLIKGERKFHEKVVKVLLSTRGIISRMNGGIVRGGAEGSITISSMPITINASQPFGRDMEGTSVVSMAVVNAM